MKLRDRVCVVTGASSGIGWATAVRLARRGNPVVAVARREERLAALLREIGGASPKSFYLAGDLAERGFAESVVAEALARAGRIDVLVNNAAAPMHKLATRTTPDEVEATLRTNFLAAVWLAHAALPSMLAARRGVIVNVSSVAAQVVPPREGAYAASKAALEAWSAGLWNDLSGSGVHVAIVRPGPIDTEIWDKRQEPSGYAGRRWPASDVADAIVRAVERRRHEVDVPARAPSLVAARWLRRLAPGLLRYGMAKLDPVPPGAFGAASEAARTPERTRR